MEQRSRWAPLLWLSGSLVAFLALQYLAGFVVRALKLGLLPGTIVGSSAVLAVAVSFALADRRGLRNLGLTVPWEARDVGFMMAILLFHGAISVVLGLILQATRLVDVGKQPVASLFKGFATYEPGVFLLGALVLCIIVGLGEEGLFRGYIMTRLEQAGLGGWWAISLSALLFGVAHWPGYGFLIAMTKAVSFGLPTGIYFHYRRNLGPLAAMHGLMDYFSFVLVYVVAKYMPGALGF